MNEYANLIGILLVLLIQAVLLYECLRSHTTVKDESMGLKSILVGLAEITEEAVDYLHDLSNGQSKPSPIVQSAGESIQQMLLSGLISRMNMPPDHGPQKQEEWQVHENENPPQNEQEI